MSCIREFLRRAEADLPVYISDVREAFAREGERPCVLLLRLYDGSERRFDLRLPRFERRRSAPLANRSCMPRSTTAFPRWARAASRSALTPPTKS